MKKQREIIRDRASMSDAEITQNKQPFENVMKQYQQFQAGSSSAAGSKGLSSLGNWGIGIISTAVVGGGIWIAATQFSSDEEAGKNEIVLNDTLKSTNEDTSTIDYATARKGINPPLPELLEEEVFPINNRRKITLTTENGSTVSIPAKAFVDKDGNTVTKDIQIRYNDFHNPVELFMSGIPMDYDSAGVNYNFESAGMFQIFAESNGEPLYLAPDKVIEVELVSTEVVPFNQYYFDTLKNEWIYLETEEMDQITMLDEQLAQLDEKLENMEKQGSSGVDYASTATSEGFTDQRIDYETLRKLSERRKKALRNEERYSVKIEDQGELSGTYEFLPSSNYKPEYYKVRWHEISVHKNDNNENYTITMRRGNTSLEFEGYPVMSEEEIAEAITEYQTEQAEASANQAQMDEYRKNISYVRAERDRTQRALDQNFISSRNIQVRNMGTWNFDLPFPRKPLMAKRIRGVITDTDGNNLENTNLYVAQIRTNAIWNYPSQSEAYYSGEHRNLMWTITPDNKLAVLKPNEFKMIKRGKPIALQSYELKEGLSVIDEYFN